MLNANCYGVANKRILATCKLYNISKNKIKMKKNVWMLND